jgi:putative addiction module component (TIGR02574 family)
MSTAFEAVLQDALRLPVEERSRIATRLIESVDADDDTDLSPAWKEEIARRIEAARNGKSRRIPHDEVMADARKVLGELQAPQT